MAEQAQERTEKATAKRRDDFRKKGQVAQSREVTTAAFFTILLLFWFFFTPYFLNGVQDLIISIWKSSGEYEVTAPSLMQFFYFLLNRVALIIVPVFLLTLAIGFLSTYLQIGWLFTTQPLIPRADKLNPIKGLGRIFSKRSLVELIKSLCKVLIIAWFAFRTLESEFDKALLLGEMPIIETLNFIGRTAALIMAKVAAIMIAIAILDFAYTRWEMEEKMKMTKQEQKEEMKDAEGDPHVKSKIRSIQQQMARQRMMAAVPEADVVITNPTRIAVALKYDADTMEAPKVLAKGQELIARRIREVAREHDIPLVENPPVARFLHSKTEVGQIIPDEIFKAVAEILAYVYSLKGKVR